VTRCLLLALLMAGCATGPLVLHQGDVLDTGTGHVTRKHGDGQDAAALFGGILAVVIALNVGKR